jgi:glucose/mannose-6-phosphate isomerase
VSLDDLRALAQIDRHDTRRVLAEFPAQCRKARTLRATPALTTRRPRVIIVAGMGGSAAGGDLLAACAADAVDVPILVHRGYGLPPVGGHDALVLVASYSGDTAEALSAFDAAVARRVPVVALTAGGALAERAAARGLPRVAVPGGLMPRMALGHMFLPAVALLADAGITVATPDDVDEAIGAVEALAQQLAPEQPATTNEAKRLALAIGESLPAIYGGPDTATVAYRWKTDIEENAKMFAVAGALPEMNHNEIEAWQPPVAKDMHAILLRDANEAPEIARRFAIVRDLIAPSASGVSEARGHGVGRLARLLTLTYLGQWTSFYLGVLRDRDPWTVPILDELKRRMRAPLP